MVFVEPGRFGGDSPSRSPGFSTIALFAATGKVFQIRPNRAETKV
jgi:hypothetical protein